MHNALRWVSVTFLPLILIIDTNYLSVLQDVPRTIVQIPHLLQFRIWLVPVLKKRVPSFPVSSSGRPWKGQRRTSMELFKSIRYVSCSFLLLFTQMTLLPRCHSRHVTTNNVANLIHHHLRKRVFRNHCVISHPGTPRISSRTDLMSIEDGVAKKCRGMMTESPSLNTPISIRHGVLRS